MSKRKRKKKPNSRRTSASRGRSSDDRVVEFLTVGWMLSVMMTLACEMAELLCRWYLASHPDAEMIVHLAAMLSFSALIVGFVALGLMAIVWKTRKVSPPRGIIVFSTVICVLPLVNLVVWLWR